MRVRIAGALAEARCSHTMFAVIKTGGKQYLVSPSDKIRIEKLAGEPGSKIIFDKVLLTADDTKTAIGNPYLSGVVVEGEILKQARDRKKIVFKYHSKTRYRKTKGHRQYFTEVKITKI
ncbi:MAG: 50S ribosomal protein L21 [Candidatus Wolfebacteria bacterium GW2011_GWC1_43_10]|uniref:Large ribosomal subunit protein bL21 n=1 Tax=Candidatus Wolfebacteria bacterium GW2011_GWC1_43_10 TaxID=1619011 RepID=A0A0G1C8H4_9BACT|nr:MAG: 50S ribosomal protein L21 [Candidatus Wolfebacteria bacterium GW2011_GWC1_43_10]KKT22803.1 MAG: 50S ribosomal protein L21 [Parcubacteria group bacterium GW2011_GWB1_43_8b]